MAVRIIKLILFTFMACIIGYVVAGFCGCSRRGESGEEEKMKAEKKALERVLYVQRLYNMNPGEDILPRIQATVDSMRRDGRNPYYYAAVNVLIDRLFSKGRFSEADSLAVRMAREAGEDNDSIAIAMARRVRAQMFYKLFIPKRSLSELAEAPRLISNPYKSGSDFGTATSIQEWLWIINREMGDTVAMNKAGVEYATLVEQNRIINRYEDTTGHYPVTALAYKAAAGMTAGRRKAVAEYLDSASSLMNPGLPARAYEHLYEVRSRFRAENEDFRGALADIDTLLSTHKDFPWFYLKDLRLKTDILIADGKYEEAAEVMREYMTMRDSIVTDLNVRRLKDLSVLHRAEVDREQQRTRQARTVVWVSLMLFLIILLVAAILMTVKERKQNRLLVARLREFDKSAEQLAATDPAEPTAEVSKLERLERHLRTEHPFTDPALGRKELAAFLGITPEELGKLVKEERGVSVKTFINAFRLEEARRELGSDSNESIAELAARLGFGTARTLQRAFKDRYAMSPSQYREVAREIKISDSQ